MNRPIRYTGGMDIIDMHTHAFPDKLAERAIPQLEATAAAQSGNPWKAVGSGTIAGLLASMDQAGIRLAVICSIATKPEQPEAILKWSSQVRGDRIEPFLSLHPQTPDKARWIERFAREGYKGIKLHPLYQGFPFDDPAMDEAYAACAAHGLIVVTHSGRDIAFPPDNDCAHPRRLRRVIRRHPSLKLLCTHMGGWENWTEVENELLGENVLLETSFSLHRLDPKRAAAMIRRHGVNRVMMGSDWPWYSQAEELRAIRNLGLTETELQWVLHSSAARLLRLEAPREE